MPRFSINDINTLGLHYSPVYSQRKFVAAASGPQSVKIESSSKFQFFTKSILAGGIAGGLEICITMPTEYVKTQLQLQDKGKPRFNGIWDCVRQTVKEHGVRGLYRGLAPLVVFSIPKAAIRFATFDAVSDKLKDEKGNLTRTMSLFAGLCAGTMEAICVVCPAETIKVKLIHDMNLAKPQYKGMFHGVRTIVRQEGLTGIYKGLGATIVKQGSNQAIRFFTIFNLYSWYRADDPNKTIGIVPTFFFGTIAGAASVFGNTPVDVIKTRLQGLEAHKYKGIIDCAVKVWKHEGPLAFYKGTVPRLGRVCLDVGFVFVFKEQTVRFLNYVWKA